MIDQQFDQLIFYEIIRHCTLFAAIRISSTCTEARNAFLLIKKEKLTLFDNTISDAPFCNAWLHDLEDEAILYLNARLELHENKTILREILSAANLSDQVFRKFSNALYYERSHLVMYNLYDWLRLKISLAFVLDSL